MNIPLKSFWGRLRYRWFHGPSYLQGRIPKDTGNYIPPPLIERHHKHCSSWALCYTEKHQIHMVQMVSTFLISTLHTVVAFNVEGTSSEALILWNNFHLSPHCRMKNDTKNLVNLGNDQSLFPTLESSINGKIFHLLYASTPACFWGTKEKKRNVCVSSSNMKCLYLFNSAAGWHSDSNRAPKSSERGWNAHCYQDPPEFKTGNSEVLTTPTPFNGKNTTRTYCRKNNNKYSYLINIFLLLYCTEHALKIK